MRQLVIVVAILGSALGACSDDDGGSSPAGSGGAAGSGDAAGAGAGGQAGASGTGGAGTGGSAGTPAVMSVPCGSATCMVDGLVAMFGGEPCCFDASTGACGTSTGGGECTPPADPGMPDDRCTPSIAESPIPLTGCCVNDMCGLDLSFLQQGCLEFSQLSGLASMFAGIGGGFTLPDSRRCDEPPPEPDADAGI